MKKDYKVLWGLLVSKSAFHGSAISCREESLSHLQLFDYIILSTPNCRFYQTGVYAHT